MDSSSVPDIWDRINWTDWVTDRGINSSTWGTRVLHLRRNFTQFFLCLSGRNSVGDGLTAEFNNGEFFGCKVALSPREFREFYWFLAAPVAIKSACRKCVLIQYSFPRDMGRSSE